MARPTLSLAAWSATIGDLVAVVADIAKVNIVIDPQLSPLPSASFTLVDVEWTTALLTIGSVNDLAVTIGGDRLVDNPESLSSATKDVIVVTRFARLLERQSQIRTAGENDAAIAHRWGDLAQERRRIEKESQRAATMTTSYRFRYADPYEALNYLESLYITFEKQTEKTELQTGFLNSASTTRTTDHSGDWSAKQQDEREKNALTRTRKSDKNDIWFALYAPENLITISAPPETLEKIIASIATIDTPPRQVYIDARIVEVQRDSIRDLGIEWGGHATGVNQVVFPNMVAVGGGNTTGGANSGPIISLPPDAAVDPATGAILPRSDGAMFGVSLGSISGALALNARLFALEKAGVSRTLSNPKVVAINGGTASIKSGREIPYQSVSANNGTNVQFKEAVISLSVSPIIMDDNQIRMRIEVQKDEIDPLVAVAGAPSIKKKEITTNVIVDAGGSAVLGGVFEGEQSDFQNRTPGLHDIPLLGWLFKNDRKVNNALELLVFITPTVVEQGRR
jgi:type IV pilus secretin PilQ/predicted competence protein